jgi:hypothetical protein
MYSERRFFMKAVETTHFIFALLNSLIHSLQETSGPITYLLSLSANIYNCYHVGILRSWPS